MGPERSGFRFKLGGLSALFVVSALPASGKAAPAAAPAPLNLTAPPLPDAPPPPPEPPEEVTPPPPSNTPPLVITGYVDVGFAKAQGNGTSFPASWYVNNPYLGGPADY